MRLLVTPLPQNASFREIVPPECAFPYGTGCRMRFSVECAFPHLGKRRPTSRKSALCVDSLTQKRTLPRPPHAKAHSGLDPSRRSALCPDPLTQKRILRWCPHEKPHSGGSEDPRVRLSVRISYRMRFSVRHGLQNALFRRVRFSSTGQTSSHLTKKRILCRLPHGKVHSGSDPSRKTAFCPDGLTRKRTLCRLSHAKVHSADHDAVEFSLKAAELMDSQ